MKEKIKSARIAAGMSQNEIAEKTGMSRSQYQQYEQGKRRPKLENLSKIAKACNVDIDYFLKENEE